MTQYSITLRMREGQPISREVLGKLQRVQGISPISVRYHALFEAYMLETRDVENIGEISLAIATLGDTLSPQEAWRQQEIMPIDSPQCDAYVTPGKYSLKNNQDYI